MKAIAPILLALAGAAGAQTPPPAVASQLQPLAFLVGSCWRGDFPGGRGMIDTHCFSAAYGGHYVRDVHVVGGGPAGYGGETLYRWDPASHQIRFDYFASDGGYGSGTVAATPTGLGFPDQAYVDSDGSTLALRTTWTRDGADGLLVVNEARQGGAWHEMWRMRWQRTGAAPA